MASTSPGCTGLGGVQLETTAGEGHGLWLPKDASDGFQHTPCPRYWPFLGVLKLGRLPSAILGFSQWLCSFYLCFYIDPEIW